MCKKTQFDNDLANNIVLNNIKGIFIVWGAFQGSRRSELIAKQLKINVKYIYLTDKKGKFYIFFKYFYQAIVTFLLLSKEKPDVVFIQNPPPFASLITYIFCFLFKKKFLIDTHTGALIYPQWQWTIPLQRFLARRALYTITTNEHLANTISSWNANSFVLEDPPIDYDNKQKTIKVKSNVEVVFICVGYYDEPVEEVIEVACNLPNMTFYITGDFRNNHYFKNIMNKSPSNVIFTGFLKESYFNLLQKADIIICLTKDDHTFQSGANEALWLGKPLITSNWKILKNYFNKGTIHVDNTVESIHEALVEMNKNLKFYEKEMLSLQVENKLRWYKKAERLVFRINKNFNLNN